MRTAVTALHPFVPSGPDFALARAFFHALGFETQWENKGVAGLRCGGAFFILQEYNSPEWAQNQMIVIEVEDLDAWWAELQAKDLEKNFPGVKIRPPTDFPWGREIHLTDPAGVCWHVRKKA